MHDWKKSEMPAAKGFLFSLLAVLMYMQSLSGMAETQGIVIREVSGSMLDNTYTINANIDYRFSAETEKALIHGVPLQFDTSIKVKKQRRWLWDETISAVTVRYRLQYHPLSGYYLVTTMHDGERRQFKNLSDVLVFLGTLENYPLFSSMNFNPATDEFYGQICVKLDIQSLPTPLRPLAYISTQWHLSSPAYTWSIHP